MIEWSELQNHIGASVDDGERDLILALERAAVDYVQRKTGRFFGSPASTSFTKVLDGLGDGFVRLPDKPNSITAVETRHAVDQTWQSEAVADFETDVEDERAMWLIWTEDAFPAGRRTVRVTYTAGYTKGQEPALVRQWVRDLVALLYASRPTAASVDDLGIEGLPKTPGILLAEERFMPLAI